MLPCVADDSSVSANPVGAIPRVSVSLRYLLLPVTGAAPAETLADLPAHLEAVPNKSFHVIVFAENVADHVEKVRGVRFVVGEQTYNLAVQRPDSWRQRDYFARRLHNRVENVDRR